MNRREFLRLPFIAVGACELLSGFGDSSDRQNQMTQLSSPPCLTLSGEDEGAIAQQLRNSYEKLVELAKDTSKRMCISIHDGGYRSLLVMHYCEPKKGIANYKHVRIVKEPTGKAVRLT